MYGMLTSLENNTSTGGVEDQINGMPDGKVNMISHLWTLGVNVGDFCCKRGVNIYPYFQKYITQHIPVIIMWRY